MDKHALDPACLLGDRLQTLSRAELTCLLYTSDLDGERLHRAQRALALAHLRKQAAKKLQLKLLEMCIRDSTSALSSWSVTAPSGRPPGTAA